MLPDVEADDRELLPSITGLSWLAVLMTSLSPRLISQAQPEPKRPMRRGLELLLELVEAAEGEVDRLGELPPGACRRPPSGP